MQDTILVTGGAGFIGSAFVRHMLAETTDRIVNIDKLTYAGNLDSLLDVAGDSRYFLEQVDICDAAAVRRVFADHRPRAIVHLAAESHVDRSIDGAMPFIQTNVVGTFNLLEAALEYWQTLARDSKPHFRFLHVSTDEVFGSLGVEGHFTEDSPYQPRSPYSASKAASDHLARAWHHTHDLPVLVTNCSNNYGPYQFPEKLIPLMIINALHGKPLPVYGKGSNVRDWLYVDDHVRALRRVLERGAIGETYNIGGNCERANIDVVREICSILSELAPDSEHVPFESLITFVQDRPGHDLRYAIDAEKIRSQLDWSPEESFGSGLRKTVEWYLREQWWWQRILNRNYRTDRVGLRQRETTDIKQTSDTRP